MNPRQASTFATQMVWLTLGVLLPLLMLLGGVVYRVTGDQLRALEAEIADEAIGLARAIDEEVGRAAVLATTLAEILKRDDDLRLIHSAAKSALATAGYNIVVHDTDGQQLVNAALPYGADLRKSPNLEHLKKVLASDRALLSNLVIGASRGLPVVSVSLPVRLQDRAFVMNVTIRDTRLRDVADGAVTRPDYWRWGIVDRNGLFVARSQDHDQFVGKPLPEALLAGSPGRSGVAWQTSVDGTSIARGWARTKDGWLVAVAVPREIALRPLWVAWGVFGLTVAATLALSFFISQQKARFLQASVSRLVRDANDLGQNREVRSMDFEVQEFQLIHNAMVSASTEQQAAEERRSLLVQELQHRTKNLLAVALSLTRRILRGTPELDAARAALGGRLQALSDGTDALASGGWVGGRLHDIVASALDPFGSQYVATGPDVLVEPQWAMNLSLIMHELATNAAKHGALSTPAGKVNVMWSVDQRTFKFSWVEEGGPTVTPPTREGFGRHLLRAMA